MKLNSAEIINTGGGCLAAVIPVQEAGIVKSFVVNEEGITAYSLEKPFDYEGDLLDKLICIIYDWGQLIEGIGIEMAVNIYKRVSAYKNINIPDGSRQVIEAFMALEDLHTAAGLLDEKWVLLDDMNHTKLSKSYPFDSSFEDVADDIRRWKAGVFDQSLIL